MAYLCLAALAFVMCGLAWSGEAAADGRAVLPVQARIAEGADGGTPERIEEAWKALPEGVRAALDEELAAWMPHQWLADPIFEDRLALLLRNDDRVMLCLFEQKGDAWALLAKNDTLVRPEDLREDMPVGFAADRMLSVYLFNEEPYRSQEFFFEQDADGALTLGVFRDMGSTMDTPIYRLDAREGGYLLSERLAGGARVTTVYSVPGLGIGEVNKEGVLALIRGALDARNEAPETPPPHGVDALPAPEVFDAFKAERAQAVYAAPGANARALKGAPLAQGWLQVFGVEEGWALVQHNIGDGMNRIGYVPADAVPTGAAPALSWTPETRVASIGLTLTDDPLRSGRAVLSVAAGETVRRLASFGAYWAYVETEDKQGGIVRGFMIDAFLTPEAEAPDEADELAALADYWIAMYGKTGYLDAESKERARKAYMSDWPPYDIGEYNALLPSLLRRSAEIMLEDDRFGDITVEILARRYVPDVSFDPGYEKPAYQIWIAPYEINAEKELTACWVALDAETGETLGFVPGGNG